jgi:hypothetical protein
MDSPVGVRPCHGRDSEAVLWVWKGMSFVPGADSRIAKNFENGKKKLAFFIFIC